MSTLLLAEHDNATLNPATHKAMTAAAALGAPVHVLVAGENCAAVVEAAAKLTGVSKVLHADGPQYPHRLAEEVSALILSLADGYETIMAASTNAGKNILPRVAANLDIAQISDIIAVHDANTFERPIYAGNAQQTVRSEEAKKVITVRTAAFEAAEETGSATVEQVAAPGVVGKTSFVRDELSKSDRPELASAKIVISGGRGMQSGDNFAMIERVADQLHAAVGASRAAVDAGYVPNEYQVGQTGKVVAPDLYIAVGISGAIQHLAGMKDSKVIVAINKDEEAPIFQVADYGLVADLFEVLPQFEDQLKAAA
ncbi:MAG: FAD-binding protein [Pseudomonadota bacterium]